MNMIEKEDEQLIQSSIQEYRDDMELGFDRISFQLYEYTVQIVSKVFRSEENCRLVTEHILKRLEQKLDNYDINQDFYPWYSQFICHRMYRIISNKKGNVYHKDQNGRIYRYRNIEEDLSFKNAVLLYQDTQSKHAIHLHTAQRLLLVMYVNLGLDIDRIAEICRSKRSEINSSIAEIRAALLSDNTAEKADPGMIDLMFPNLSVKKRTTIDLCASLVALILFTIIKFIM